RIGLHDLFVQIGLLYQVLHFDFKPGKKLAIEIPSLTEQKKITDTLSNLDATIALHQRKHDLLLKLKKGYLQKLFPQNGDAEPELRFSGFTDAWEKRQLGEIAKRVTRKNTSLESTLPLTISAQDGLVDQNDYFKKQVASKDVSGYYLVKIGEFAYNKSYSKDYPLGAIKRLDKYDKGVLSTLYIVFEPKNVNTNFLATYFDSTCWYEQVGIRAAEGARNHGLLNIAPKDFFEIKLQIPHNEKEQVQVAAFFQSLDETIALHQRKLGELKELKKAYLQKMFV
ncbi:restriction endonuclease subunit S, partial [Lacticaseibacillus songhuajiangensis]|uniref:restriction endonuclease subunit S n=1 Tax=Lacticaseibacillus songhuajiangensis TaxID=1296539 RepID=UPI001CDCCE6D